MWERLKRIRPFWWFVAFFVLINVLWIGPTFLGSGGLKRGSEAPVFELPLVGESGATLSLAELRGHTVLAVFWATWCDACLAEIPVVLEMMSRFEDRGLTVVGMNVEPGNRVRVAAFLEAHSIRYPNVTVDDATAAAYRVQVLPALVVIDAQGRVCRSMRGRTGKLRLSRAIEQCLAGGADPT